MEFENNLKLLRLNSLLSQSEVAKALHITRSAYAQYERGARRPDVDMLCNLSKFYNIRVEFLFNTEKRRFINDISVYTGISAEEKKLLDIFDSLSEFSQGKLLERAESILERDIEIFEAKKWMEARYRT